MESSSSEFLLSNPHALLALSLSAPTPKHTEGEQRLAAVEVYAGSVRVLTPPATPNVRSAGRLLCTKESIHVGAMLLDMWLVRRPDQAYFESDVLAAAASLGSRLARYHGVLEERPILRRLAGFPEVDPESQLPETTEALEDPSRHMQRFLDEVRGTPKDLDTADSHAIEALRSLEDSGLAIDPGITAVDGLIVLLGFVPMRFSVRTPEGERVYKEIRASAPFWDLKIQRMRAGRRRYSDWSLNLRGVGFVRNVLRTIAMNYLAGDDEQRSLAQRPRLPPPRDIQLEGDEDAS